MLLSVAKFSNFISIQRNTQIQAYFKSDPTFEHSYEPDL